MAEDEVKEPSEMSAQVVYGNAAVTTTNESASRTLQRRAVEAAVWGMPLVSVDAMRQAFFRDAGARYGDVLYFSRPANWRFQIATPDASSMYVYFNFNVKDGPVVFELPPSVGAGLSGTLVDAWDRPLVDVGLEGDDRGKGARYLLLPPYDRRLTVDGYLTVRCNTANGYGLLRAIPARTSVDDVQRTIALVKRIRVYPMMQAAQPPPQRHIDIAGILFDGIVRFDDSFFDSLARMVNEEPMLARDVAALANLRAIGIEKDRTFRPDQQTRDVLKAAMADVHAHLMHAITAGGAFWPGSQWILSTLVGPRMGMREAARDRLEVDERGMAFFLSYAVPRKVGAGTFYTGAYRDAGGEPLEGERRYRLHIPADVPVRRSWAVAAYDLSTAAFIRDAPQLAIDSSDRRIHRNADGSVDVHFGPTPPGRRDTNWIYTAPGRRWFSFFRFHRPERALFDKTWVLPDIERVVREADLTGPPNVASSPTR